MIRLNSWVFKVTQNIKRLPTRSRHTKITSAVILFLSITMNSVAAQGSTTCEKIAVMMVYTALQYGAACLLLSNSVVGPGISNSANSASNPDPGNSVVPLGQDVPPSVISTHHPNQVIEGALSLAAVWHPFKKVQLIGGAIGLIGGSVAAGVMCAQDLDGSSNYCKEAARHAHSGARIALSASNLRVTYPAIYFGGFVVINTGSKTFSLYQAEMLDIDTAGKALLMSGFEAATDMYWMAGVDRLFNWINVRFDHPGYLDFMVVPDHLSYIGSHRARDEIYNGVQLKRWMSRSSELVPIYLEGLAYSKMIGSNTTAVNILYNTALYQGSRIGVASVGNTGDLYGRDLGTIATTYQPPF
jgi:hypothetical protein